MQHANCLNCGQELHDNFCAHCGQSAHTHRFSLKHIFSHDLVHGLLHLDSGFFYTAKMLLIDPGNSIRDYIAGKRVRHYNYIAFVILIVAINHLMISPFHEEISRVFQHGAVDENSDYVLEFVEKYQKEMVLMLVPISSFFSFLLFKKSGYNYAENMVLNTYMAGGNLLVNTITTLLAIAIASFTTEAKTRLLVFSISGLAGVIYNIAFYWQFFQPYYKSKYGLYIRSIQAYALPYISLVAIALFILFVFGKVHIG